MVDEQHAAANAEIYEVLAACRNDELAALVNVLAASPASFLKIGRAFEIHDPDHVRYADRIGDEIYRLGVLALSTRNEGRPSYDSLIGGLCRKIGVPEAADTGRNEDGLLNMFAVQHLGSLRPEDRQPVVDAACLAASAATAGILSSDAWPPFAAALLQTAHLRRKLVAEGRMPDGSERGLPAVVTDGEAGSGLYAPLVLQTEDGAPVLSVARLPEARTAGRPVNGGGDVLGALAPILKALQPLVAAEQILKDGNFVRVGIEGGAAALSYSKKAGALVGSAQGYKGQVPFFAVAAGTVAWPAALLMLTAAMIEQRKMEAIERGLEEIKMSLRDVSRFQKDERRSTLTGSIRYFGQVARAVLSGELSTEVLHEIERHEAELVRVQDHLAGDLQAQLDELGALKKGGWTSSKYVKAIEEQMTVIGRSFDEMYTCIRARACGYQLLAAYPGRELGKKARLEDIGMAAERYSPTGDVTVALDRMLRGKLEGISSYETKAVIFGTENALFDTVGIASSEILAGLADARSERLSPLWVDFRLENGQPVDVRLG